MAIPRAGAGASQPTSQRQSGRNTAAVVWEPLVEDTSKYIICMLYGLDQSGKTHFAFSAPKPVLCLTFDPGNIRRGVAKKYAGQDIQLATFEVPKGLVQTAALARAAEAEAGRYHDTFMEAVTGEHFKTLIMDREDEAWEIFRFEEFDGKASQKAHNFVQLNARYKGMLKMAEKYKKNLIMIDACKDEWKNEKPTGKKVREGFKHLGMLSQLTLEAMVDDYDSFSMQVVRCRDDATKNGEVINKEYLSGDLNFANTMAYLIGGSADDWY